MSQKGIVAFESPRERFSKEGIRGHFESKIEFLSKEFGLLTISRGLEFRDTTFFPRSVAGAELDGEVTRVKIARMKR